MESERISFYLYIIVFLFLIQVSLSYESLRNGFLIR